MKLRKTIAKRFAIMGVVCLALGLASCDNDDDDNPGDGNEATIEEEVFFISLQGAGAEYIGLIDDIESGTVTMGPSDFKYYTELEQNGYTWIFNPNPSMVLGLIYSQGDPGLGLAFGVINEELYQYPAFDISTRFTSYGFCGDYAITSVGGQTPVDENGNPLLLEDGETERADGATFNFFNMKNNLSRIEKTILTSNIAGNGEQATFSGIVNMGDGTFLTGMVLSQPKDPNTSTGGASTGTVNYPDSVWVARFDTDLNLLNIYRDDRISYSAGRYRSQYYSQIGKADNGYIYVFSGSYDYNANATSNNAGALRIAPGSDVFDPSYHFDIESLTGGYRFRKVWHITGDYFLLEVYNHVGRLTDIDDPATQYAVVNMSSKSFEWVRGGEMPSYDEISATGQPYAYDGKIYFPIAVGGIETTDEDGNVTTTPAENPAIYIIDPTDPSATKKGLTVRGPSSIRAVGRMIVN
ncbi:MAG: DUF4374 domain-containing protein [Rikenellaceae bacterium]|nr:DUF4374 domain-containing protein [Rikenellaceae bacterium]